MYTARDTAVEEKSDMGRSTGEKVRRTYLSTGEKVTRPYREKVTHRESKK